MSEITPELLQLGAVAIIFLFCAREFFVYLKIKKINGGNKEESDEKKIAQAILEQVQIATTNHLIHIQAGVEQLNCTIRDGNEKVIALLSEIKGQLSK